MAAAAPRTSLLVHSLLLVAVLASFAAPSKAIDCRRFVFAPQCRGIIAKRTAPQMPLYEDTLQDPQRYSARPEDVDQDYRVYAVDQNSRQASDMEDSQNEDALQYIPPNVMEWIMQNFPRHNFQGQRK
ncbi:elevenin-Vc1-like [Eriocheir sinensis]|uniref:elevenin-Vc1-like n=1 Tax=Eriocheir sinensis TaxID=95602 RepID=UPI0021CA1425|nr:elevenin-Vc1-like [Eriocheir sinensis]